MDAFERRTVFHQAADLLEKEGWIKGHMQEWREDGGPAYCMVGALRVVTLGSAYNEDEEQWDDEGGTHESYGGINANVLITWNDSIAGNVETVVQRLREMAAGKHSDLAVWRAELEAKDLDG